MAKKRVLYFFQHKETKNWIAGIDKDGRYEYSPKMCDAMLFFWMQAAGVSTQEHKREWVQTRAWTPPRARSWKPKAKPKSKKSTKSKAETAVKSEPVSSDAQDALTGDQSS